MQPYTTSGGFRNPYSLVPELQQAPEPVAPAVAEATVPEPQQAPDPELPTFANAISVAQRVPLVPLVQHLMHKGELACVVADSNVGKSIYSIQMGEQMARNGHRVGVYDFEMDEFQVGYRYMNAKGETYPFNPNLMRPKVDFSTLPADPLEAVMTLLDRQIKEYGLDVVILDNLACMCPGSETGEMATKLMSGLKRLSRMTGVSILVVAHCPKRDMTLPLTQNDLGGSKRLFNFFDSVFALNFVPGHPNQRYLKQLKCRMEAIYYDEKNVQILELRKDEETGFLGFHEIGTGCEETLLKHGADTFRPAKKEYGFTKEQIVLKLIDTGMPYSQISDITGISKGQISNIAKKNKAEVPPPGPQLPDRA